MNGFEVVGDVVRLSFRERIEAGLLSAIVQSQELLFILIAEGATENCEHECADS